MSDKRYALPIMWYEGMPLEPATFQQSQLHVSDTIAYLFKSINTHSWGVTKLVIDQVYLAQGTFAIKELECSMPDFSTISFCADGSDESSNKMMINLKEHSDEFKNKELFVFLTLPDNHLSYTSSVSKPRYESVESEIQDFNSQDITSKIYFLKPNYALTLAEYPAIGSISIPLAKVKFTGINYQLSTYSAPTQQISNSPIILSKLEQLIRAARDKIKYLSNKEDESFENKFLIMNIANIIFPIENIVKTNASPCALFDHLIKSLAHALVFLKDNKNVPTVPEYNHLDHVASISPLVDYINNALDFVKESYKTEHFTQKDGIFAFILPENYTQNKITIGLYKKANNSLDSTLKWITNAIITTEDKLTTMQDQRIIGAKRSSIKYSDKLDIKTTNDMLLIEIALDPSYITPNKMICIMNLDLENAPESIQFFVENK